MNQTIILNDEMDLGREPHLPGQGAERGKTERMSPQCVGEVTKPRCLIRRPESQQRESKTSVQSLGSQAHPLSNIRLLETCG